MESCYVPNNPNFAAEQWTPPSPTSPELAKNAQHYPDPNLICDTGANINVHVDASSHYNNYASLPPVQELLGSCRSPNETLNKDLYSSGYSVAAVDFEPLPGFFTFNSCTNSHAKQNINSDMNEIGVLLSMKPSQNCSTAPSYQNGILPNQQPQQPMSPFSAAVAAATQAPANNCMNTSNHPISYSFHQTHTKLPVLASGYQDGGSFNCLPAPAVPGMFSSMSVNVSMNMTMGMGMPMSYGIESAPLPWNPNPSIHVPVPIQQNNVSNHNGYHPANQGLLSPIQVPYSHLASNGYAVPNAGSSYPFLNGESWRSQENNAFDPKELSSSSVKPQSPRINSNFASFSDGFSGCHSTTPEESKKRSVRHHPPPQHQSPLTDYENELSTSSTSSKSNLCRICGKTYARPSTLKTHMRTHSGERPYRCGECSKSFSQAANLTAHVRTHSGEKPFKCQICDRRFSQSSSVTTHMRTHSGERPYRCRLCKKAFSDSSTLTKHTRIHSGEKPYQCKLCLLRFSQSGNLNRHMRVHATAT